MFSFISETESAKTAWEALEQECKVLQVYNENNADHLVRFESFIKFVSSGDWEEAKKCLHGEVDICSVVLRTVDGWWAWDGTITLHVAAWEGHGHIVKELVHLMSQEDLKTQNSLGQTALHLAAEKGHVHVVKELPVLLMGEVKDKGGDTALHIAVQEGKVAIVKELMLLMREEDLKIKNHDGYTALHLAVNKGDMPMLKEFVRKDEDENHKDDFGPYIPFTDCVNNGDWEQVNDCLRKLDNPCGAATAVDTRDDRGDTALHVAAKKGYLGVIRGLVLLLKKREEDLELKTAEDFITFGSGTSLEVGEELLMERAKYMVDQWEKALGCIMELQNTQGRTPLLTAVINKHVDIVKELAHLMRREGLEIKNAYGFTTLHIAVTQGNMDIVKELAPLMRQEGLEIKNAYGFTALHIAVGQGKIDIVKELAPLMRPEGLEIKKAHGRSALLSAVAWGYMDIVRELMPLVRPEAFEDKGGDGFTILSCAILSLKEGDVCELATHMAEKNVKVLGIPAAPDNEIPVVFALRQRRWEVARYIYSLTPFELIDGPNGSAFI